MLVDGLVEGGLGVDSVFRFVLIALPLLASFDER